MSTGGLVTWRSKILQHAAAEARTVAQTCRYFGISRNTYYKWRFGTGLRRCGLCDRDRVPHRSPHGQTPYERLMVKTRAGVLPKG